MILRLIKSWIHKINNYDKLSKRVGNLEVENVSVASRNVYLNERLNELTKKNELEEYWNNHRVKVTPLWKARDGMSMDVRCFFQKDETLKTFEGSDDEIISDILAWTISNIKYVSDEGENWQFAYETKKFKTGDCEDGAILMANMAINSGIPYWKIRLNKGYVKLGNGQKGYHCFMTYFSEEQNDWFLIDWCYWPQACTDLKLAWKNAEKYFQPDTSWNKEFGFRGLKLKTEMNIIVPEDEVSW